MMTLSVEVSIFCREARGAMVVVLSSLLFPVVSDFSEVGVVGAVRVGLTAKGCPEYL